MQNHKLPDKLPPLDLMASFEAAARHLSFTRAAAERFVTQSAMSRQMRALEDELGVALFTRRHRALALTADGQRLFTACTSARWARCAARCATSARLPAARCSP
jgi:hypothetical protein